MAVSTGMPGFMACEHTIKGRVKRKVAGYGFHDRCPYILGDELSSPRCKWRIPGKSCDVVGYAISRSTWQPMRRLASAKLASDLSDM
jgi:hypothetical protein